MNRTSVLGCAAALAMAAVAGCSGGEKSAQGNGATATANTAAPVPQATAAAAPAATDTATLTGATLAQFTGTAEAGRTVFAQCAACHVVTPGQNRIGPSMHNIVGRRAGTVAGFNYTPANRNSGITWSPEKLFQYLENPARIVPGTRMAFAGIPDPQRRADLIAYLAEQGSAGGAGAGGNMSGGNMSGGNMSAGNMAAGNSQ